MAAEIMYVTPAGAGNKNGLTWGNAFGLAEFVNELVNNAEAGDIYYVAGGTYNLSGDMITALDGTSQDPIKIIGVKAGTSNAPAEYSDWAFTTDRPLFACGNYKFQVDDYWVMRNLVLAFTGAGGLTRGDTGWLIENCKITQVAAGTPTAISCGASIMRVVNCEVVCTNGYGIIAGTDGIIIGSYIHDTLRGIWCNNPRIHIWSCIIANCTLGIWLNDRYGLTVKNNTIYNCDVGLDGPNFWGSLVLNNIIEACGVGAQQVAEKKTNLWDYNNWRNTLDVNNVTKGPHATAYDPKFINAGAGNFALDPASECVGAGFSISIGVG